MVVKPASLHSDVTIIAGHCSWKIFGSFLDRIFPLGIITAVAAPPRRPIEIRPGKQVQLPTGNWNASVAANSVSQSLFPERWHRPSLGCCSVYSVLMYPILFSVAIDDAAVLSHFADVDLRPVAYLMLMFVSGGQRVSWPGGQGSVANVQVKGTVSIASRTPTKRIPGPLLCSAVLH